MTYYYLLHQGSLFLAALAYMNGQCCCLYSPHGAHEPKKHKELPIRVSQEVINEVVESGSLKCTHFGIDFNFKNLNVRV